MTVLSAPNDGDASDWLRPPPWQREGDKLPKGVYQPGGGYSTRVAGPSTQPAIPRALQRETSHISPQGKEAVLVTHDTLPQVVKASALYYKNKNICTRITVKISTATLRADKSKKTLPFMIT